MDKICRRLTDGKWFEPSCPPDYTEADATVQILTRAPGPHWYFCEVRLVERSRWLFWTTVEWERTDYTWRPLERDEFVVLDEAEARELWALSPDCPACGEKAVGMPMTGPDGAVTWWQCPPCESKLQSEGMA